MSSKKSINSTNSHSFLNKSTSFINTFIGGLPHSKSSTNVNSISGNIAASTASILTAAAASNNDSSQQAVNLNNRVFKITKSTSSFNIKENQLQLNNDQQKQFKKLIKTAPPVAATTTTGKTISTNIIMDTSTASSQQTQSSSKIKLPSFNNSFTKKLKSKFSIRKSHSTASNLSDIAKLKISTSTTSNSLTSQTNTTSTSSSSYNKHQIADNNGINYTHLNSYKSEPYQIMNYRNSISFIDSSETKRNLSLDESDLYNSLNNHQYYNSNHHSYYHHSFIDSGFTAIQEEQLPNNLLEQNNQSLQIQNLIQPSSSSSSLSLTNTINNPNTMSHTLTSSSNSTKCNNYASSTSSNATTATTTSNSLASSDMASTSTSSPHNILVMPNNLEYQQHASSNSNNKNTPSKHSLGSFLSSISSSFSLSSSSSNNNPNQVKMRVNKSKLKAEMQQKRISLPANITNNHNGIIDNDIELNQYFKNKTPPLIESDEPIVLTNENHNNNNINQQFDKNSNYRNKNLKILNNNTNLRNNEQIHSKNSMLTKHGYNSSHQLNYYTRPNQKINNSLSINQLNNKNLNQNSIQSYQSMSAIAMNHKTNPTSNSITPLNRNSRRASMSELGYGKIESYNKLDKLGEGTYATVFKGQSTINGSFVALKEIRLEREEGAPCTAIREVSLLQQLKHANIVTLHDIIYTKISLTLVFEYLEKDLKQYMDDCNNMMNMKNVKLFLFQLLRGLAYCHAKQILHRDLKPQNLLINQKGELKLADFGLARAKSIPTKTYSNEVVTLWYRPPDVLLGSTDYSTHIDMWGVGCIFYEMVCGKPLFPGTKVEDELYLIFKTLGTPNEQTFPGVTNNSEYLALNLSQFQQLDSSNYSSLAPRLDTDGLNLLASYLKYNPKDRASAADSMHHRFFLTLPSGVYKLENNQSIFDEPSVTLTKDPGIKLSNAGIRNSSSSYYKF